MPIEWEQPEVSKPHQCTEEDIELMVEDEMSFGSDLSPKVKDLVVWLNRNGFQTCGSGDGSNYMAGKECALEQPMIAMQVSPLKLAEETMRLYLMLREQGVSFDEPDLPGTDAVVWPYLQASYNPHDGVGLIVLFNVTSDMVRMD